MNPNDRWNRTLMAVASHLALLVVWYLFVRFGATERNIKVRKNDFRNFQTKKAGNLPAINSAMSAFAP